MTPKTRAAYLIGTWMGMGHSPFAPGTVGSLGAIPLHWVMRRANPLLYAAVVGGVTLAGLWASQVIADDRKDDDPGLVVIDEVAGVLIAMGLVKSGSLARQTAAWVLFRFLDIYKPGPIATAEKAKPKGLGIMLDDLVAGGVAGLIARLL